MYEPHNAASAAPGNANARDAHRLTQHIAINTRSCAPAITNCGAPITPQRAPRASPNSHRKRPIRVAEEDVSTSVRKILQSPHANSLALRIILSTISIECGTSLAFPRKPASQLWHSLQGVMFTQPLLQNVARVSNLFCVSVREQTHLRTRSPVNHQATSPAAPKHTLTPADVSSEPRKPSSLTIVFGSAVRATKLANERPRG